MEVVGTVNEGEVDLLDAFAQARKVPLSHQVGTSTASLIESFPTPEALMLCRGFHPVNMESEC